MPEEWETKRVAWMREHGVRRWADAAGRAIELEPLTPATSEGPGAGAPAPSPSAAAPGPSAKGPRGFR